jgi:hypothetical protein
MSTRKTAAVRRAAIAALLGLCACTESTVAPEPATLGIRASADSLASNGLSSVVVTAELPPSLPQDGTVEFTTSLGRFANPGAAPERKVTIHARGGIAEARLFAAGEVGTAYVTVSGGGTQAQTTVELTPSLPEIIDLFADRTAAPADGATAVNATAVLRRVAGSVSRGIPVRFEVQDSATGAPLSSSGGVVVADSASTARFRLTSTVPGTVLVRASVGAAQSDPRFVRFTPPPAVAPAGQTAPMQLSGGASHLVLHRRQQ